MRNDSHFCTPVPLNNITFQVLRLSTFVFNKCSENENSYDYICGKELKGFWLE